jgi:uncharacterized protein YbcI
MSITEDPDGHAGREPGTLARLATEMVRMHKHYWGRGPESAKAYAMDDLVFIVMRGGVPVAERTLLDAGRQDSGRANRQEYQNDKATTLCGIVEEVTGRRVLTYQSQILFDPDLVIEVFVLDERVAAPVRATAREQLRGTPESPTGGGSDAPPG